MSLYCVMCCKVIRMSDSPTHYGVCDDCPINKQHIAMEVAPWWIHASQEV